MRRPDDSTLASADLRAVEERATSMLDRADAWDRFPIPVDDILEAAGVRVAATNAFSATAILSYLVSKATDTGSRIKNALGKVFGLYDATDGVIHVDTTVVESKQTFLKLHETGHHDLPTHRRMYRFFEDSNATLDPVIADQFEREANNFARFVLFKGSVFSDHAADCPFEIKTPIRLAKKFGASLYASVREFARSNHRSCVVYVLNPVERVEGAMLRATIRRVEQSHSFRRQFPFPLEQSIGPNHFLWPAMPIGRKMTRPVSVVVEDINRQKHECIAEGFDTTHNILILVYPLRALSSSIVVPLSSGTCRTSPRKRPG